MNSRGLWRIIYGQFFKAALLYSVGSILAGVAIDFHRYYTGSLYDVPLVAAMAWFATIGLMARGLSHRPPADQQPPPGHSMWYGEAWLTMLAVFSTPPMVVWAEFGGHAPQRVRSYRLLLTAGAMVLMGGLSVVKQHWMDRKLLHLLRLSRQNLDEMCQLKDELENKEQSLRWHSSNCNARISNCRRFPTPTRSPASGNRRYLGRNPDSRIWTRLRNYERARGGDLGRWIIATLFSLWSMWISSKK